MTTASNNGAIAPLAVVTEKVHAMLTTEFRMMKAQKVKPVNHAPYTVAIPSTMSETAWLIRLARKGATMLTTANGERVAQVGHAVRMTDTYPTFAPRVIVASGSVSGVSLSRVLGESNADLARGNASDY